MVELSLENKYESYINKLRTSVQFKKNGSQDSIIPLNYRNDSEIKCNRIIEALGLVHYATISTSKPRLDTIQTNIKDPLTLAKEIIFGNGSYDLLTFNENELIKEFIVLFSFK